MADSICAFRRYSTALLLFWAFGDAQGQTPGGLNRQELTQAQAGNPVEQWRLGLAYAEGRGVPQDYAKAAGWYRKSAEQGNVLAQTLLAALYDSGRGVPKDYARAALWYRKAAEQGNISSCWFLATYYQFGKGVPKDLEQAAFWYQKGADKGDPDAQDSLGLLYEDGQGVPQDFSEAYFWMSLAAAISDGHDVGKSYPSYAQDRDRLAARLTSGELLRVQARTRVWFAWNRSSN